MRRSLVDRLRALPAERRREVLSRCSARELAALRWCWREFWARPDERDPTDPRIGRGQVPPPGPWDWWANIGGRASGKTETCARWVTDEAMRLGRGCYITLLGPTVDGPNGARKVMVEGPSGLAQAAPTWSGFDFRASVEGGIITWRSGAKAYLFGADRDEAGRGPQCSRFWIDDPAAFGKNGMATLRQLLLGFRLPAPDGSEPQGVVSSTPIDSEILDFFLDGVNERGRRRSRIVYSFSSSDDNRANLAESFFRSTLAEFEGTELEAQERYGQRLKGRTGKVFGDVNLDALEVAALPGDLLAVGVWIDPATSSTTYSCEVGIVVVAVDSRGWVYLVEDLSDVMHSTVWPDVAVEAVERWSRLAPTHLGIEVNKGGEMGPGLLAQAERLRRMNRGEPGIAFIEVRVAKAAASKTSRAAPVVRLARAGSLKVLPGLGKLKAQLRDLDEQEGVKRDRADAAVHGVLDLALGVYAAGGARAAIPAGPVGPAPLGSVNVGPTPGASSAQSFQFGMPAGGWR